MPTTTSSSRASTATAPGSRCCGNQRALPATAATARTSPIYSPRPSTNAPTRMRHTMSDESQTVTTAAVEGDHWPTFSLSPAAYEKAVADIVTAMDLELTDWQV